MYEFFNLPSNPLFVKHVRSRLRRPSLIAAVVVTAFFCLCILWIDFQSRGQFNPNSTLGSHYIFWMQSFILLYLGGSQVASSVSQMKSSGIIDFHRITPLPASIQTVGIMLGAPIRELILFAITIPFGLLMAIQGNLGPANYGILLLVQLTSALMWYSFALVIGLTAAKARGASGQYTATVIGLTIVANGLFQAGIYGPTLITSMPVYHQVLIEPEAKVRRRPVFQQPPPRGAVVQPGPGQRFQQPVFEEPPPPRITFYGLSLPLILQTFMFQGALLIFQFIAASRRLHSARLPLYQKPTALLFLFTLAVLTLGSLWDSPIHALALGTGYFLTLCSILLTNTITPQLGDIVKGVQRARKLSELHVPVWSDLSSSKVAVAGFAAVAAAVMAVGILAAPQPPGLGQFLGNFSPWPCLVVTVLVILSYGFAKQYCAIAFGTSAGVYFALYIFLTWVAPFLLGIIISVANVKEGTYILAMSPIVAIAFAGQFQVLNLNVFAIQAISISTSALSAIAFFTLLLSEERKLRREVAEEHGEEPEVVE